MQLTEHGVEVLKAIKSEHVEALGAVLCADEYDAGDIAKAVEENRETLRELMRIIRVVPLGMPR